MSGGYQHLGSRVWAMGLCFVEGRLADIWNNGVRRRQGSICICGFRRHPLCPACRAGNGPTNFFPIFMWVIHELPLNKTRMYSVGQESERWGVDKVPISGYSHHGRGAYRHYCR